jgi:cytochrome c peroxidase
LLIFLVAAGCQRAGRYPPQLAQTKDEDKKTLPANWAWLEPQPTADTAIVFVPDTAKDWPKLPDFWNHFPPPPAGTPTSHFGLPPVGAAAAVVLAAQLEVVKIKVPPGLPDPRPFLPEANPPTVGKWYLGKKLFSEPFYRLSQFTTWSCADCHVPKRAFTDNVERKSMTRRNTPSLINCVYNRHQFWDGRVRFLEQTIVRDLNDENVANDERPGKHIWAGLLAHVRDDPDYRRQFQKVFGIHHPTQDTIAKALATYMRTLLSGDSIYDRAWQQRSLRGQAELSAKHFEAVLDESALKSLEQTSRTETASKLVEGYRLFHGKARCHLCHAGPLFTDFDFHNIGLDTDVTRLTELDDQELGRFAVVPIGLKESRLRGAFKTPTLRSLPRTRPYMHDGRFAALEDVVRYFNRQVQAHMNSYLASQLLESSGQARHLDLNDNEVSALVLFLHALDGQALALANAKQ